MKILVIEDNAEIQEAIAFIFELYMPEADVIPTMTGLDGINKALEEVPGLILLDLGLPDIDGLKVLREIRSFSNAPVVILTVRGEEIDRIRGLELGADDYIVKPFTHKELLARLHKVLERIPVPMFKIEGKKGSSRILTFDPASSAVIKDSRHINLNPTEVKIFQYLWEQDGKLVSNHDLLFHIWGPDYIDCSNYLTVYMRQLASKIEDDIDNPRIILNDRQGGYRIIRNVI